ncbi:hypothetical protein UFOVP1309_3 [uncultured Caudovirales phage]|uniref:DUF6378 domain-containing protein n=1 Tax=uncultured Caudovirales phage TaxID=2100421 RepID=A0A6J5RMM4_9CAUD|nr:hypothetical protein UFOVP1309_3 [uncultured Caudovirales phage]
MALKKEFALVKFNVKYDQLTKRSQVLCLSFRVERAAGGASIVRPRHPSTFKRYTMKTTANQLLNKAASHMQARAATYDKPEGERSMAATVAAYNAITGQAVSEANGWLFMALLKMVRDNQRAEPHTDSVEDLIAYAALYGEARLNTVKPAVDINSAVKEDWTDWIDWTGEKCPIDDRKIVQVKFKNLDTDIGSADMYFWTYHDTSTDIIAYRLVK